jgi:hypothetical protein
MTTSVYSCGVLLQTPRQRMDEQNALYRQVVVLFLRVWLTPENADMLSDHLLEGDSKGCSSVKYMS